MERLWVIAAILVGCVFLGDACNFCVPKEDCLVEKPRFEFHWGLQSRIASECAVYNVCCDVLRDDNTEAQVQNVANNCETDTLHTTKPFVNISFWPIPESDDTSDPQAQVAGKSNPRGLGPSVYVTNDQSVPGQYPWVVAIFYQDIFGTHVFGGSLIRPGVVLTSFHHIRYRDASEIVVRAGEWDMDSSTEQFKFEERGVDRIVRHERFDFETGANNLALLFLNAPFELQDHIRIIALPEPQSNYDGLRCTAAGWGKKKFGDRGLSNIMKKVDLRMLNRNQCEQLLRRTNLGNSFNLPDSLICAGGELNKDTCTGDGGSALFCPIGAEDSGLYEQVGIVNWGMECGHQNVPATYTNVAMFRQWIEDQLVPFTYRNF
ncbi:phenoloxidase-activating factor 2-like isoform X2 [Drosophila elegans]|uniref:phenoloxidase-activating factor 2-like isoform X2 n=1 Tax=Drosophila elegans TaxID=30023 RepID=UPI001BC85091|nr:phenoloxidase-activating factor 2-like isoform X2 [Drosophila elegans]